MDDGKRTRHIRMIKTMKAMSPMIPDYRFRECLSNLTYFQDVKVKVNCCRKRHSITLTWDNRIILHDHDSEVIEDEQLASDIFSALGSFDGHNVREVCRCFEVRDTIRAHGRVGNRKWYPHRVIPREIPRAFHQEIKLRNILAFCRHKVDMQLQQDELGGRPSNTKKECYKGALKYINDRLRKRNGYRAVGLVQGKQRALSIAVAQPKFRDAGLIHRVIVSIGGREEFALVKKGKFLVPSDGNRMTITKLRTSYYWGECRFLASAVVKIINGDYRISGWALKPDAYPNSAVEMVETLNPEMLTVEPKLAGILDDILNPKIVKRFGQKIVKHDWNRGGE